MRAISRVLLWHVALALLLLSSSATSRVHADDDARARARELFERAAEARAAERWEEVRQLLEESLAVYPQFSTAWNLVTALERTDDPVAAEALLERIRGGGLGELDPETQSSVAERLAVASAELATIVVLGPAGVDGRVTVDGATEAALDPDGRARIRVVPGVHVVGLTASGGRRAESSVEVPRGDTRRVTLALVDVASLVATPAPPDRDDGGRPLWKSPWLWLSVAAVLVAGGIVATLLLVEGPVGDPVTADVVIPPF